jgi:hypothetical protein
MAAEQPICPRNREEAQNFEEQNEGYPKFLRFHNFVKSLVVLDGWARH